MRVDVLETWLDADQLLYAGAANEIRSSLSVVVRVIMCGRVGNTRVPPRLIEYSRTKAGACDSAGTRIFVPRDAIALPEKRPRMIGAQEPAMPRLCRWHDPRRIAALFLQRIPLHRFGVHLNAGFERDLMPRTAAWASGNCVPLVLQSYGEK